MDLECASSNLLALKILLLLTSGVECNLRKEQYTMRKLITLIVVFITATMASLASAAKCTMPSHDNIALGDTLYSPRVCNQAHINKFWQDFSFEKGDWDEGFGFEDVCNLDTPLN